MLGPLPNAAVAAWIAAQPPSAGPDELEIDWSAPAACPQAEELRRRVSTLLGSNDRPYWEGIAVQGDVRLTQGTRFELDLRTEQRAPDGHHIATRTLGSDSCEVLTDAAALLVSDAYGPSGRDEDDLRLALEAAGVEIQSPTVFTEAADARPIVPTYQPQVARDPVPSPRPVEEPVTAEADDPPPPASTRGIVGSIAAATWIASGPLPRAQPGAEIDGGPRWGRWSLHIGAAFTATGRFELPATDTDRSGGAVAWTAQGRARGCYAVGVRPALEFPFCLGAEAGAVVARGFGLDSTRRTALPWLASLASVDMQVHVTRMVAVFAGAEGFAGPLRPVLTVGGVDSPVTRGSLGGVRGRLGVRVHFSGR